MELTKLPKGPTGVDIESREVRVEGINFPFHVYADTAKPQTIVDAVKGLLTEYVQLSGEPMSIADFMFYMMGRIAR